MKVTVPLKKKVTWLFQAAVERVWKLTRNRLSDSGQLDTFDLLEGLTKCQREQEIFPVCIAAGYHTLHLPLQRPRFYYISKSQGGSFQRTDSCIPFQVISLCKPEDIWTLPCSTWAIILIVFKNRHRQIFHKNEPQNFLCTAMKQSASYRSLAGEDSFDCC